MGIEVWPAPMELVLAAISSTQHKHTVTFLADSEFAPAGKAAITIEVEIYWLIPGTTHFGGRIVRSSYLPRIAEGVQVEGMADPDGKIRDLQQI
jgi:hypothetical protein